MSSYTIHASIYFYGYSEISIDSNISRNATYSATPNIPIAPAENIKISLAC